MRTPFLQPGQQDARLRAGPRGNPAQTLQRCPPSSFPMRVHVSQVAFTKAQEARRARNVRRLKFAIAGLSLLILVYLLQLFLEDRFNLSLLPRTANLREGEDSQADGEKEEGLPPRVPVFTKVARKQVFWGT